MIRAKFISGIELRSSDFLPHFYVSRCGTYIFNSDVPYLMKRVIPKAYSKPYHNLTPWKSLHQAVAHSWVFNPCPSRYTIVDHINGNTHDNRADESEVPKSVAEHDKPQVRHGHLVRQTP